MEKDKNILKALPVPEHLQVELDKVDWKNIASAWGNGETLPEEINGLLSGDEQVASECEERIWWEMAYHGELFEATYTTATIIARMLPFYKQSPVVEQRILGLLYKIMTQTGLRNRGYSEMIATMEFLTPQLFQWAGGTDPVIARQAQHILIHVGKDLPETETFLQREWQNTEHPQGRRGYALYCLGWFYWLDEEYEKINTQFLSAFQQETNTLLRVIQSIFLIRISEDNAEDSWVTEIINILINQDAALKDLDNMQALVGEYGSPEFLINFLQNTDPAKLAKHIRSLIMAMLSHDRPYQETLLRAITPILFANTIIDYKNVRTAGSRITLLALAELAEKDPDFLKHHSQLLLNFELPPDVQQIRDLARPASVPEGANYMDRNNPNRDEAHWVMSEYDPLKKEYFGDYTAWDINGNLLEKRTYDKSTGALLERHEYDNGKITYSKWYVGEVVENCYHKDIHPPVVKVSRVYRNHNNDRVQTIFDEAGRQLYSVQEEIITDYHQKRYYNGILVYEGIQNEDNSKAPLYVRYFYPDGATLIDYTSNNDGTGIWRLYDESGQEIHNIPERDERGRNVDMDWDEFMTVWLDYGEEEFHMPDWDAVKAKFKDSYQS